MLKRFIIISLLFYFMQTEGTAQSKGVFCRYSMNGKYYYGSVKKDIIHTLDSAPWEGGKETGQTVPMKKVKLLHPSEPTVILGLSQSYKDAWKEKTAPKTVRWFLKPPTSAASPGDDVILPASLDEVKVETELVIVIGKSVKDAGEEEAEAAIFGYTVGNDLVGSVDSYHRVQGESMDQPEKLLAPGLKIGDGFAPFGPFIYTHIDWRDRERTLRITNPETGKNVQYRHNTSNLQYSPAKIVSDLSKVLTLSPGDVIFTGTSKSFPARPGDDVVVTVEGLGECTNRIKKSK